MNIMWSVEMQYSQMHKGVLSFVFQCYFEIFILKVCALIFSITAVRLFFKRIFFLQYVSDALQLCHYIY